MSLFGFVKRFCFTKEKPAEVKPDDEKCPDGKPRNNDWKCSPSDMNACIIILHCTKGGKMRVLLNPSPPTHRPLTNRPPTSYSLTHRPTDHRPIDPIITDPTDKILFQRLDQ